MEDILARIAELEQQERELGFRIDTALDVRDNVSELINELSEQQESLRDRINALLRQAAKPGKSA